MHSKKKCVLFGYGYWGSKLARVIQESDLFELIYLVEPDSVLSSKATELTRAQLVTIDQLNEIKDLEVAFVATPSSTHYEVIKMCLNLGLHVWSEKPFTVSNQQTIELVKLSRQKNLQIFVDHTFVYTSSIQQIKTDLLESGDSNPTFYHSTRCNFAAIQSDGNVIQDLAVHDLGIFFFLFPQINLNFSSNFEGKSARMKFNTMASIHLTSHDDSCSINLFYNWLSPIKIRTIQLGTNDASYIYDDMLHVGKLKKYMLPDDLTFSQKEVFSLLRQNQIGETTTFNDLDQEALGNAMIAFGDAILHDKEAATGASHISQVSSVLQEIMEK
jgi:predicted dehydrogenase